MNDFLLIFAGIMVGSTLLEISDLVDEVITPALKHSETPKRLRRQLRCIQMSCTAIAYLPGVVVASYLLN